MSRWLDSVTSGLVSQPVPAAPSPGPWSKRAQLVPASISGFTSVLTRGGTTVAYVAREADADLFIAAPGLLAGCRAALEHVSLQSTAADTALLIDLLRLAIARAEGHQ